MELAVLSRAECDAFSVVLAYCAAYQDVLQAIVAGYLIFSCGLIGVRSHNQDPMAFQSHEEFREPSVQARLWRYMDFAKFVSVLETNSLFFASADRLGDRFEGSFPMRNQARENVVWSLPRNLWADADAASARMRARLRSDRKFYCVNCWHESEHESDAMWKLYANQGVGVALQTSFGSLCDSVREIDEDVYIGRVNYIDYEKTFLPEGNLFKPFTHKRLAFAHEKEVRALIWVQPPEAEERVVHGGVAVPVDVQRLVESIVVNPLAPTWFFQLVKSVVDRYGIKVTVSQSRLDDEPAF